MGLEGLVRRVLKRDHPDLYANYLGAVQLLDFDEDDCVKTCTFVHEHTKSEEYPEGVTPFFKLVKHSTHYECKMWEVYLKEQDRRNLEKNATLAKRRRTGR